MVNLLSANLLRLRKSKIFWGLLLLMFGLGLIFTLHRVQDQARWGARFYLTVDLFTYALFLGFGMAAFIPLFLGAEYSDGAIRNKIIAGRSRLSIYLAHLVTSIAVSIAAAGAYVLPVLAIGAFVFEPPDMGAGEFLLLVLGTLALLAAYCALYTLVAMNCGRKSAAAVGCLLGMFALYMIAGNVEIPLMHPEYLFTEITDTGEIIHGDPNPRYVGGMARKVLETLHDLLPTGQSLQYMRVDVANPARLPLYSLIDVAAFTAIGAALFRRKDLK